MTPNNTNGKCCPECRPQSFAAKPELCVADCPCHQKDTTGWEEKFERLLEKYSDYDGDSDTMYFKTVVPNMETRQLDDNYELFLVVAKDFIRELLTQEREKAEQNLLERARALMPKMYETIDNHKRIRSENTRERVKILLTALFYEMFSTPERKGEGK